MRNVLAQDAFNAGRVAKARGSFRTTPYYENPRADYWWLAGFDGMKFEEAEAQQPDFPGLFMSAEKAREMGMPVPAFVQSVHVDPGIADAFKGLKRG